jgi:oligoribonuclease NrnB/cAMP/cGMP phosphodiesterase (DHH superfamily)
MIEIENNKNNAKENDKIGCVFHHDLDGLTSCAEVLRAIGQDVKVFVPQDPNEDFPEIVAFTVIIVDIAITEKTYNSLQNIKAEKILWIDHHKPFQELSALHFPENVQVVLDPASPSAVLLVQKFFGLNDKISQEITDLGTKADTWKIDSEVQDWMDLDSAFSFYQKDKTPLIQRLAEGEFEITGDIKEILEKYRNAKAKAKQELIQNTVVREVKGHLVAIGLAPEILSGSESADLLLKETGAEIQIVLKSQGWMSFRRAKTSQVNLLQLAKLFNGGGHEYAAGGELGKPVSQENFAEIAEEIFEKVSEVL